MIAGAIGAYMLTNSPEKTYSVTADVEQAPNLFEDGRVMVRGVQVGSITEVEPQPDGVRITMEIGEDTKVPADARLAVVPITVISDRYVQLLPAYESGPTLQDGDHLGVERTTIPAELDEVLTQLEGLLGALEPRPGQVRGPLVRLIESLDEALDGRSEALGGAITNSAAALENLAESSTEIQNLILNLDVFFAGIADRSSEIGLLNERFALVAEALAADQENLEGTLENVTLLSNETAGLINDSGDDIADALGELRPVVNALLRNQRELTRGMQWTNVIAQALGETDASGKGLFAYSGRQSPPGGKGAEYNYRLDTRDTVTCERLELLVETSLLEINPNADLDGLVGAALTFIAPEYQDELEYLLYLLIPLCADYPGEDPDTVGLRALSKIERLAGRMSDEEIGAAVTQWLLDGSSPRSAP